MVKRYLPILIALSIAGCATNSELDKKLQFPEVPENWQITQSSIEVKDNWLAQFAQNELIDLVNEALTQNYALRQEAYGAEILKQRLLQSEADFWPTLDLDFSSGRSRSSSTEVTSNSHSIGLESGYEIDIWGKLSAAQQQANLNYLASVAQYQQSRQTLVASVVSGWFDLITAKQLLDLAEQRVENSKQNLDIIESGYRQGLNSALDVYLSRNELNSEISNLADQQTSLLQTSRTLERLLGRYPSGKVAATVADTSLPLLDTQIPTGLPADVITRKPELKASWYQVLAEDAGLAYAHKQRFPSFNLSASISDSTDELSDLLSGSSFAWSLIGSIAAPIFRAGDLKANEEAARLTLKQQEQAYLDTLFEAFSDVENAITTEKGLKQSYLATVNASKNAKEAETLSFEQYQKGLVTYTTVLEAQGRSFDAQNALIQIKNQLLANRVDLHIALGGDFADTQINQEDVLTNE
ncbi:efflux transporter outer membrane subunit [uncultured Paraglaciecola sp.]|uniref:efflux transporter outer membrane subunit n=1 Tax=uncultured Paraglaciecola sp. TaxID=1765024 RepID=UPI0025952CB2|nr:efflux transporter outer membrane subunit [uncultured Paraglaciecola sp.]